jgi:ribosomal-protein-alanine N-acetyltransferase
MGGEGVMRHFPSPEPPSLDRVETGLARIAAHWTERGYGIWAVTPLAGGALMGRCGLFFIGDTGETEIDFLFGREHWGRGYATEAASAVLAWGFAHIDIPAIVGIVHPENVASKRVLEKIGLVWTRKDVYFGMACERYEALRDARPSPG